MTNFSYKIKEGFGPLKAYRFVVNMNGVTNGGNTEVDVDGDAMTLPQAFTACAGYVSTDVNGGLNNEVQVGTSGDPDKFLVGVSVNGSVLTNAPFDGTTFDDPADVTSVVGETVRVTNTGSAAFASDVLVTIVIIGYLDS